MGTPKKRLSERRAFVLLIILGIASLTMLTLWIRYSLQNHSTARPLHLPEVTPVAQQTESAETQQQRQQVNEGNQELAGGVPMRSAPGVKPKDVDPSSLTGGCVLGYGRGKACLPFAPPSQKFGEKIPWTCEEVRTLFPDGIAVNRASEGTPKAGVDPLRLDGNKDFIACDSGDK